jgi:nucleotide-binding universal stress UspA family protein
VERERLDEQGFVPNLERLLLAVDASPVGRMAARLAGLVAGGYGMPVTILKLDADLRAGEDGNNHSQGLNPDHGHVHDGAPESAQKGLSGAQSVNQSSAEQKADPVAKEVKTGARASAAMVRKDEAEADPDNVHLISKVPLDRPSDVVRDEAGKGYDLLVIGLEETHDRDGNISPDIAALASGFGGPLALLAYDGDRLLQMTARTRILVPVNGSAASRRAAEVAFVMARATGARVSALFVSRSDGRARTRAREEGVLKTVAELGERYDLRLSTRISKRGGAAEAILKEAGSGYDMIVMGVSARPGEDLFFGNTATTVLRDWKSPLLLLAS